MFLVVPFLLLSFFILYPKLSWDPVSVFLEWRIFVLDGFGIIVEE